MKSPPVLTLLLSPALLFLAVGCASFCTEANANKIGRVTTVVPRLAPHPIPNDRPQPRLMPFR